MECRKAFVLFAFTLVMLVQQNIVRIFKLSFFPKEARKPCLVRWLVDGNGFVLFRESASQHTASPHSTHHHSFAGRVQSGSVGQCFFWCVVGRFSSCAS